MTQLSTFRNSTLNSKLNTQHLKLIKPLNHHIIRSSYYQIPNPDNYRRKSINFYWYCPVKQSRDALMLLNFCLVKWCRIAAIATSGAVEALLRIGCIFATLSTALKGTKISKSSKRNNRVVFIKLQQADCFAAKPCSYK